MFQDGQQFEQVNLLKKSLLELTKLRFNRRNPQRNIKIENKLHINNNNQGWIRLSDIETDSKQWA